MAETGDLVRVRDKLLGTEFTTRVPFGGFDSDRYAQTQKKPTDTYGNPLPPKVYDSILTPSATTTDEPAEAQAKEATK